MQRDRKKALGAAIRNARRRAGMTGGALAGLVGVTPNHLYRVERGVRTPSLPLVSRIFLLFGDLAILDRWLEAKQREVEKKKGRTPPSTTAGCA
jgi:transcriptional regulator with XRE-family HTH domain